MLPGLGGQVGGQVGQQVALVGHAVAAQGADHPEQVVDGQVVAEALVGHGVVADGVAGPVEAGDQPPQPVGGRRLEVVALVVPVAEPGRPAAGQLDHAVLLVGLQGDPGRRTATAAGRRPRPGSGGTTRRPPRRRPAGGRGQVPDEVASRDGPPPGPGGRAGDHAGVGASPAGRVLAQHHLEARLGPSRPVRTVSQAGSRTIAKPGKRPASSAPSPAASSRWTSTPLASSLARLTRTELVIRAPSDSLSMNGASARYTVRTDEVGDQGRPGGRGPPAARPPAARRPRAAPAGGPPARGAPGPGRGRPGRPAGRARSPCQQPGQQLAGPGPEGGVLGHDRAVGPEPVQRERRPQLGGVAAHLVGGHGLAALGRRVQRVPGGQGLLGPQERRRPGAGPRAVGAGQERWPTLRAEAATAVTNSPSRARPPSAKASSLPSRAARVTWSSGDGRARRAGPGWPAAGRRAGRWPTGSAAGRPAPGRAAPGGRSRSPPTRSRAGSS